MSMPPTCKVVRCYCPFFGGRARFVRPFFDAAANDLRADHIRFAIDESGIDERGIKVGYGKMKNKKLEEK